MTPDALQALIVCRDAAARHWGGVIGYGDLEQVDEVIAAVERWHAALAKGHDPDTMSEQMEAAFDVLEALSPPTTKEEA